MSRNSKLKITIIAEPLNLCLVEIRYIFLGGGGSKQRSNYFCISEGYTPLWIMKYYHLDYLVFNAIKVVLKTSPSSSCIPGLSILNTLRCINFLYINFLAYLAATPALSPSLESSIKTIIQDFALFITTTQITGFSHAQLNT